MEYTKNQVLDQIEYIKSCVEENISEEGEDFNFDELEFTTIPAVKKLLEMLES